MFSSSESYFGIIRGIFILWAAKRHQTIKYLRTKAVQKKEKQLPPPIPYVLDYLGRVDETIYMIDIAAGTTHKWEQ